MGKAIARFIQGTQSQPCAYLPTAAYAMPGAALSTPSCMNELTYAHDWLVGKMECATMQLGDYRATLFP